MSRRGWATIISWCAIALVFILGLSFLFRESQWKTAGGVTGVSVFAKPPTHGFVGLKFGEQQAAPLSITKVIPGSGAEKAGLKANDIILSVGSKEYPDAAAFVSVVQASKPGDVLPIKVKRGNEAIESKVKLIDYAEFVKLSDIDKRDN